MFDNSSRVLWNVQFFDHVIDASFYLYKSRLWFWILELNDVTWKRSLGYRSHKRKTRKQSLCITGLRRIKSHMWYFVIYLWTTRMEFFVCYILSCSSTNVLPWDTTLWMVTENYFLIEGQSNLRRHLACVHPPLPLKNIEEEDSRVPRPPFFLGGGGGGGTGCSKVNQICSS